MSTNDYDIVFDEYAKEGDPRWVSNYVLVNIFVSLYNIVTTFRFLFANFTSSLLIVNSTLLAFAALALLGLGGLYSVLKYVIGRFLICLNLFSPRVSFLLFDYGKVIFWVSGG